MQNGKSRYTLVQQFMKTIDAYEVGIDCTVEEYEALWERLKDAFHLTDEDILRHIDNEW
jgi:hypothetical protein